MASTIRIKRSTVTGNPTTLAAGELAYSSLVDNGSNGGSRLYIGMGTETGGNAANHIVIGGQHYTSMIDAATNLNTLSTLVLRDSAGNFSAGIITATLAGNAATAATWLTNRTLSLTGDGSTSLVVNGSADVSATFTLATVNSNVGVFGSATSIPIITVDSKGRVTAVSASTISTIINLAGGTGTGTINGGGTLTFTGTSGITTAAAAGSITIGIDSTVATLTGIQTLTNKTLTTATLNSPTLITPTLGVASGTSLILANGMVSTGAYGATYTDGLMVDYVAGIGRFSVGSSDGYAFYNSADTTRSLLFAINSTGAITNGSWNASTIGITYGGTGATTQQGALNALAGTQIAGRYLRSDGTNTSLTSIQAADVPTLNQNTSGSAASAAQITGVQAALLDMGNHQIKNVLSGTAANDAVTFSQLTTMTAGGITYLDPVLVSTLVDDSLVTPPVSPVAGKGYIAAATAGGWIAGHLYARNDANTAWDDLTGAPVAVGAKLGINMEDMGTAAGSFTGKDHQVATVVSNTPGAFTYTYYTPAKGDSVYVNGAYIDFGHLYYFDSAKWIDLLGGASTRPTAGIGLTYNGNTLDIINVPVTSGGTGAASFTAGQMLIGNGTSAVTSLANTSLAITGSSGANATVTSVVVDGYGRMTGITYTPMSGLTEIQGGTNQSSYAVGDTLYASGVNTLAKLTKPATASIMTMSSGGVPTWESKASTSITGLSTVTQGIWNATTIGTTYGGTGLTAFAIGDTVYASGVNTLAALAKPAVTSLLTMGTAGTPIWVSTAASAITGLGTVTAGVWNATTIGVAYGGTNVTAYAVGDILVATGATTLAKLSVSASPGQVLQSNGTTLVYADIDGGTY
jgi:hypothetical protein